MLSEGKLAVVNWHRSVHLFLRSRVPVPHHATRSRGNFLAPDRVIARFIARSSASRSLLATEPRQRCPQSSPLTHGPQIPTVVWASCQRHARSLRCRRHIDPRTQSTFSLNGVSLRTDRGAGNASAPPRITSQSRNWLRRGK